MFWLNFQVRTRTNFGEESSGFADGRHEHCELARIARTLSLLEPKVQKRNCSSVEQIQEDLGGGGKYCCADERVLI